MPVGMFSKNICVFLLLAIVSKAKAVVLEDEKLKTFLGTLEKYENTRNDVVFLLDESGSIGVDRFPEVKLFTELIARRLSVSSEFSRVAVVTFATEPIIHINHIQNPDGNNMCSLMNKIRDIGYVGEWTHTDKAMRKAESILAHARPDSNKIVILLSDGQSNDDHSPISIANQLKSKGVIIFAVGVVDVNDGEMNSVASSTDHVYKLTKFDYIVKINREMVKDANNFSPDLAKDQSNCVSPCDENAKCYCGDRSGDHLCLCNAGYFGIGGYAGQCHRCPKGTYSSTHGNSNCTACPDHSTTKDEGSTSSKDCVCDPGYETNGTFCAPIRCAALTAPKGGILIPAHCDNTYGSQCSFQCHPGYCPFSCQNFYQVNLHRDHSLIPPRICLETGKWSNEEFLCEKMTCPAISFPLNGKHNCSEEDFTHGTTCHFICNKGFEHTGSQFRTCLSGSWTGQETVCKEKFCDQLKTNDRLHVKPSNCSAKPMSFRSVCVYSCAKGYALVVDGNKTDENLFLQCEDNKKWSGRFHNISCQDVERPKIKCPKPITVNASPHKGVAEVQWDKPNATDNVHVEDIRMILPKNLKKPFIFPIGQTKVVYEAVDTSKLNRTCSFTVTVRDREPPRVVYCPKDIEVYHEFNTHTLVTWDAPQFEDDSGNYTVTMNRKKTGDKFSWGPPSVVYFNASDASGNTASCKFTVKVKHYPCPYYDPPANGILTCDNWEDGRICRVFCHEGFEFAANKNSHGAYFCRNKKKNGKVVAEWGPLNPREKVVLPWSDCSRKQPPLSLNVSVGVIYSVDTCSDDVLRDMKEKFFKTFEKLPEVFCPKNKGCSPENVHVTCNPITSRRRRLIREVQKQELTIRFDVMVFPNETELIKERGTNDSSNFIVRELENKISLDVKNAYNMSHVPHPSVEFEIAAVCSVGQINVNNSCINCPSGTYKDDVSETCIPCPQASYQDEEGKLSCKACPVGFTTYQEKSKSKEDCKGPCQPGTYSETTFEPCLACPRNTYQNKGTRKDCQKCPEGLYTWRVGANSSSDCVAPCKAGSFSDTGYEPCSLCDMGSFQNSEIQKSCIICPNRTSSRIRGAKSIDDCKEIDLCGELSPCEDGSTCVQNDKDYECICPPGLTGRNCEINFDDCASSPCLNNGTCIDDVGNFTCLCFDGWTGHQCEINIDDCASIPCLNGGKCIDKVNAYECQCRPGFTGEQCEENIYECEPNPCLNNGTCFDKENGYRCCCTEGYFGLNCESAHDYACNKEPCQNGGSCYQSTQTFSCTCTEGFEGEFCEINIDDCKGFSCQNGGVCVDGIGSATCICPKRFVGLHCEKALTPEFYVRFPTATISNYAKVENKARLYAITVSFFMRTTFKDSNSRATPVSYSYKYQGELVDNAITFLDTNNFVLYIHGSPFHTEYKANSDAEWHHYAVTWEKTDGKWSFYVDGKLIASGNTGQDKYMHPGTFILGQDQDNIGGQFTPLEAFVGDITEFNVWDYAKTNEEIKKISSSCGNVGNIIPWYIVSQSVYGDVVVSEEVDKCKDIGHCSENSCDCFYSDETEEYSCKNDVEQCIDENTCSNGQPCISDERHSFCNCSEGFEGRHCEYDIDECLERNGGCQYFCVNGVRKGSYHCECPEDMILAEDGKTCKDTSYCLKDEQVYMNGEVWMNSCQNCSCVEGVILCDELLCSEIVCHPEETMITFPGECCPKCVAWSFCLVSLNDTITSFDMSKYQIEGGCTYTAVEDCISGRFKVLIETPHNSTDEKNVIIYQDCYRVVISSNGSVSVDGDRIELPFENEEFSVEKAESFVSVKTNSDLLVQWNLVEEAIIAIPITEVNKMCGMCSRMVEYFNYGSGKLSLPERMANDGNECYIITENYEENLHLNTAAFTTISSGKVLLALSVILFHYFSFGNRILELIY